VVASSTRMEDLQLHGVGWINTCELYAIRMIHMHQITEAYIFSASLTTSYHKNQSTATLFNPIIEVSRERLA
jgi:hypothetical protein